MITDSPINDSVKFKGIGATDRIVRLKWSIPIEQYRGKQIES